MERWRYLPVPLKLLIDSSVSFLAKDAISSFLFVISPFMAYFQGFAFPYGVLLLRAPAVNYIIWF
jgi:hypothetical protein